MFEHHAPGGRHVQILVEGGREFLQPGVAVRRGAGSNGGLMQFCQALIEPRERFVRFLESFQRKIE